MGCILQFLLFIFILAFIGAVRFWWTIRSLMNNVRNQARQQQNEQNSYNNTSENYNTANSTNNTVHGSSTPSHKKVFEDNEGEYVEFEEIKD